MSTPAAKKRRMDAATATLRKPFTSPFIKDRKSIEAPTSGGSPSSSSNATSSSGQISRIVRNEFLEKRSIPQHDDPSASPPRVHKAPRLPSRKPSQSHLSDNSLLSLVVRHKKDQMSRIKELDQKLETIQQARHIVAHSESKRPGEPIDIDLRELIEKWKEGSRQAADELFEIVKERISNAGGLKAWRDMQQRQQQFYQGFDDISLSKSRASGDESIERLDRDDCSEGDLADSATLQQPSHQDGDTNEAEFDLFAMLQSLNIDPCLLGIESVKER